MLWVTSHIRCASCDADLQIVYGAPEPGTWGALLAAAEAGIGGIPIGPDTTDCPACGGAIGDHRADADDPARPFEVTCLTCGTSHSPLERCRKGGAMDEDELDVSADDSQALADARVAQELARAEGAHLPWPVALYLAQRLTGPAHIHASLIRVVAYASLTGHPITIPLVRTVLTNNPVTIVRAFEKGGA